MNLDYGGYGLYIHFPYCLYKCHYCDFNSHISSNLAQAQIEYTEALCAEIGLLSAASLKRIPVGSPIRTIFFGGGTPSLMHPSQIKRLISVVRETWLLEPHAEITLEANPGTLTCELLEQFCRAGINRLSLGVQSLHDAYLSPMGRIHTADEAKQTLTWLTQSGFDSWSADLMYGFPGQNSEEWQADVEALLQFRPKHLSLYALTVEEGTPYARWVSGKRSAPPADDLQAELAEWSEQRLGQHGIQAYEISNYAQQGYESKHNQIYWRYQPYIGLGAGATSYFYDGSSSQGFQGHRFINHRRPEDYVRAVMQPQMGQSWWAMDEPITQQMAMFEYLMMGLRLREGISAHRFRRLFKTELEEVFARALVQARERNWIQSLQEGERWSLTPLGRHLANQVFCAFL